jgi:hypothetical protein
MPQVGQTGTDCGADLEVLSLRNFPEALPLERLWWHREDALPDEADSRHGVVRKPEQEGLLRVSGAGIDLVAEEALAVPAG